jgi:two-component system OmpR family response regulator
MRILIVEDEAKVATFLSRAIAEAGYFPEIASDAESAFQMILAEPYDVILLDNMLPGMSGRDLCANLRSMSNKTLIIMLTANDGVDDRVLGLDAGADDYLTKPFSIEELLARVRALMRRRSNDLSALTVGDLSLDPSTRKAMRGDREWTLSSREYALLEYLMRNAHRPVTRAMITQYVWGIDSEVDSNIIDVYIRYLRNKLDKPAEPSIIRSLRGIGYQLG